MMTTPDTTRATLSLRGLLLATAAAAVLALPAYAGQPASTLTGVQLAQAETETDANADDGEANSASEDAEADPDSASDASTEGSGASGDANQETGNEQRVNDATQDTMTEEGNATGSGTSAAGNADMEWSEAPDSEGGFLARRPDTMMQAEDLIGAKVTGADGESVGKVHDLLMDVQGSLKGLIISSGGVLGIGDKRVGVTWDATTMRFADGKLQTVLTEQDIKDAPEFVAGERKMDGQVMGDEAPATE